MGQAAGDLGQVNRLPRRCWQGADSDLAPAVLQALPCCHGFLLHMCSPFKRPRPSTPEPRPHAMKRRLYSFAQRHLVLSWAFACMYSPPCKSWAAACHFEMWLEVLSLSAQTACARLSRLESHLDPRHVFFWLILNHEFWCVLISFAAG